MLIFGNNNVRIKSYTPFDLGLSRNPDTGFTLEIRQNYFHLLQVPIVATGKTWHIRKGAHLDKMPEPYKQQIDPKKVKVKTPLFTFTGSILLVVGILGYYTVRQMQQPNVSRFMVEQVRYITMTK
jgi:hypothetical protein